MSQQQQKQYRQDNSDTVPVPHVITNDDDEKQNNNNKIEPSEKQQQQQQQPTPKYYYFPVEAKALVDQKLGVMHTQDDEFLNQHAAIRFSSNINDKNYDSSENNGANNASFEDGTTTENAVTKNKNSYNNNNNNHNKIGITKPQKPRRRRRRRNIYRNKHEEETDSSGQERKQNLKKKLFLARQMMLLSEENNNNNNNNSNFQQQIESSGTEDGGYYSYSDDDYDANDEDEDEFEQFQRLASLAVFRHTTDKRHQQHQKNQQQQATNCYHQLPKKFFADPFEYEYSEDEDGEDDSSSSDDDVDDDIIADDEAESPNNAINKNNNNTNNKSGDIIAKEKNNKKKRRSKKSTAFPEELLKIFDDQLRDRQKEIDRKQREFRDAHAAEGDDAGRHAIVEMKGENNINNNANNVADDENEKERRRRLRDEEERIEYETPFHIPSHALLFAGVADQELNNHNNNIIPTTTNNTTIETNNSQRISDESTTSININKQQRQQQFQAISSADHNNNNSSNNTNEKSNDTGAAVVAVVAVVSSQEQPAQPEAENPTQKNNNSKKDKSVSSNSKHSGSSRGYYSTLPLIPDWIQDLVYRSILDEDLDTFPSIVRKVAATILLMTGWIPGCFGIWFFVSCRPGPLHVVPEAESSASEMIGISSMVWGFLLAGLPWLYCRVTKEAPEWLGFANLWMLALNNLVINIGFPLFPSDIVFAVITLGMVLMSDSTGWKMASNFFTMSIIFMIVFFNRTFALFTDGEDDQIWNYQNKPNYRNPMFMFTMKNFRRGIAPEHLVFTLTQSITIAAVILLTYSVREEFSRIMNRIFSNAIVGRTIAKKLTSWDMRGIDDEIEKYGKLGHADRLLHRSLSIAVATIEEYSRLVPRRRIRLMKEIFSLDEKMKMLTSQSVQMMMMKMMMTRNTASIDGTVPMPPPPHENKKNNNRDNDNNGAANSFNSLNFVALMDQSRMSVSEESKNGKIADVQNHVQQPPSSPTNHRYMNDNFFDASVNTNNNNNNNSFPNSQRSDNSCGIREANVSFAGQLEEEKVKNMLSQQNNNNNFNNNNNKNIPQKNYVGNNDGKNDNGNEDDDEGEETPNRDISDDIRFTKNINLVHLSDVTAIHVRILEFDELCDLTCRWRPSVVTEGIRKFQTLFKRRVEQHFGRMLGGASDESNGHCQAVWGGRLVPEETNENENESKTKKQEEAAQAQQQQHVEAQTQEGKDPSSRPLSPVLLPRVSPKTPTANLFSQNQNNNNANSSYTPSSAAAALLQLSHCSKENASTLACLAAMHIYEIAKSVIKPFFDQNLNNKFNFRIQIGIAKGDLFVGSYGSQTRQAYSGEGSSLQIAKSLSYFYDPWLHFKRSGYVHPYEKMKKQQQSSYASSSSSPSPSSQQIPQQQYDLFFGNGNNADSNNNNNHNDMSAMQRAVSFGSLNNDKNNKEGIVAAVSAGSEETFFPTTSSPHYFGSIFCTEEVIQDANRRISSKAKLMMIAKAEMEKRKQKKSQQLLLTGTDAETQKSSALDKLFRDFSFYYSFDKNSQVRRNIDEKNDNEMKLIQNDNRDPKNNNNQQLQQLEPSAVPDSVIHNGDGTNSEDDEDQEEFEEEEEEEEDEDEQEQHQQHQIETKKSKHETQPEDRKFDIADSSGGPESVFHVSNSERSNNTPTRKNKNNNSGTPQKKMNRLNKISLVERIESQKNDDKEFPIGNNTNQVSMFSDLNQSDNFNEDTCNKQQHHQNTSGDNSDQNQKQTQKNSTGQHDFGDRNSAVHNQSSNMNNNNNNQDENENEMSAPFGSLRMHNTDATANLGDSAASASNYKYSDAIDAFRQTPPNSIKVNVDTDAKVETKRKTPQNRNAKKEGGATSSAHGNTRFENNITNNSDDKKPISAAERDRIHDRKYFYNMTFISRETHPVLVAPFWVDGNIHQLLGFTEFDFDKYYRAEGKATDIVDIVVGAEVSKRHDDVRKIQDGDKNNNNNQRRNGKAGDSPPNRPRQDVEDSLLSVRGAIDNASNNNNNNNNNKNKDRKNKKTESSNRGKKNKGKESEISKKTTIHQEVKKETEMEREVNQEGAESRQVANIYAADDDCEINTTELHNEINEVTKTLPPPTSTNTTVGSTGASATPYDLDDNRRLAENVVITRKKRNDVFGNAVFTGEEQDGNKVTNEELPSQEVSQSEIVEKNEEQQEKLADTIQNRDANAEENSLLATEQQQPLTTKKKNSVIAIEVDMTRNQDETFPKPATSENVGRTKLQKEPTTTTKDEEKQKQLVAKKQLAVENRKEFARARIDFAARISSSFRHLVLTSLPVTSLLVSLSPATSSNVHEQILQQVYHKNELSGNINNNNNNPKTATNSTCDSSNSTNSASPTSSVFNPHQQKLKQSHQQYLRRNSKYFFIKNHRHRKLQQQHQQQYSCSFFVSDTLHSLEAEGRLNKNSNTNNNSKQINHNDEQQNNNLVHDDKNKTQKLDQLPNILKNLFAPLFSLTTAITTPSKSENTKSGNINNTINNNNNNNKEKEDEKDLLSSSPLRIIEQINCARSLMDQHDFEKALFTLNEILLTLSPLIPQSFYDHGFTLEAVAGMRSDCKMLIDHAACRWIVNPNQIYFQNNNKNNNKNKVNRHFNNNGSSNNNGQLALVNNTNDSVISLFENQGNHGNRRNGNNNHSEASTGEASSNQLYDACYQSVNHHHQDHNHHNQFPPQSTSQPQHPPYKLVIHLSKILARLTKKTQNGFRSTISASNHNNNGSIKNRNNDKIKIEEVDHLAGSTRRAMLGPLQSSNLLGRSSRDSNSSCSSRDGSHSSRNRNETKSPLAGGGKVDFFGANGDANNNDEGGMTSKDLMNNNMFVQFQGDSRVVSITKNSEGLPRNYHYYANKVFGEEAEEEDEDDEDAEDFFGDNEDEEGGIFSDGRKNIDGSSRQKNKQNIRRNNNNNNDDFDDSSAGSNHNNNYNNNFGGPNNRQQNLRTLFSCAVSTKMMNRHSPEAATTTSNLSVINSLYSRWEQNRQKEEKIDLRLRQQLRNGNIEVDSNNNNNNNFLKKRRVDNNIMIFPMPVDIRFWAEDY